MRTREIAILGFVVVLAGTLSHNYSLIQNGASVFLSSLREGTVEATAGFPMIWDKAREATEDMHEEASSKRGEWLAQLNNSDWVHIVSTRFMQSQPDLVHLGKARLALFRTFCLPTMIRQTSMRFLWVILTDPNLDQELMDELTLLLAPFPHFFLVQSNRFDVGELKNFNSSSIVTGEFELMQQASVRQRTKLSIETRLDADDGLSIYFLEYIQNHPPIQNRVYCVDKHYEWLSQTDQLIRSRYNHCVTPGLTTVRAPKTVFPRIPHQKVHQTIPQCRKNATLDDRKQPCLVWLQKIPGAAIRSRTPTSAGMAGVTAAKAEDSSNQIDQEMWNKLHKLFGINRTVVEHTMRILESEKVEIAKENLEGQCTKGHSCKAQSREALLKIINVNATNL